MGDFILKSSAQEFFRKRSTDTRLEVDKARKYYDDATKRFQDIDERLRQSDVEAKKLLESLRLEGALERDADGRYCLVRNEARSG